MLVQWQGCRFGSEKHFRKLSATDGTKKDLNIGETRVWRIDSGPNPQPCDPSFLWDYHPKPLPSHYFTIKKMVRLTCEQVNFFLGKAWQSQNINCGIVIDECPTFLVATVPRQAPHCLCEIHDGGCFPKQFAVGVLNATLDLAALVLVGVAAFLGSEVVLAPFGSLHVRCEGKNERK